MCDVVIYCCCARDGAKSLTGINRKQDNMQENTFCQDFKKNTQETDRGEKPGVVIFFLKNCQSMSWHHGEYNQTKEDKKKLGGNLIVINGSNNTLFLSRQ